MRKTLSICLSVLFLIPWATGSLWARDGMGSGMMDTGPRYYGRGPDTMGQGHHTDWGMGPGYQGWQEMTPEQQEQWRQMRSDFMRDTLSLRQELAVKQMELETLWEQPNPDPNKIRALSNRISEVRSELDQKYDDYLTRCRQKFGNLGWNCPGRRWTGR
jgi:hypothetical protein